LIGFPSFFILILFLSQRLDKKNDFLRANPQEQLLWFILHHPNHRHR
jgi:hypothetical protein